MTRFLDVRLNPVGGPLAASVALHTGTSIDDYESLDPAQLLKDIRGQHVLIGTHGYNVNRADGIGCLSNWEGLLQLPPSSIFVALLWPGDSVWAHGLDYPDEPKVADEAGALAAKYLGLTFGDVASLSFVSHSLGARVVLETAKNLSGKVRTVTLMAAAIDNNCLDTEFKDVAEKTGRISVLASQKDTVLSELFPLGNLIGGIIAEGHPWLHSALGRSGPSKPWPDGFQAPFQIPSNWNFGHHDYLRVDPPPPPKIDMPTEVPADGSTVPANYQPGWQEAWTAAFCSTRFEKWPD